MGGIHVTETDTIQDIDEALKYLCDSIKTHPHRNELMVIVDALLDERLEKS